MDAQQLLSQMTLDEKIGQMFLLAFEKNRLDEARVLFEQYFVGASYISNDNIPTPEAALALTSELQGYAANTRLKIPLLLGVDQEGAWGVMVPASCTGPGNMALGATGRSNDAYQMYKVIGRELCAVGLNAVYAPCADCNSNPCNTIIGMRSFGEKPRLVGAMTAAAVKGAHDGGVVATIKHFPGHGDTTTDSHRGLPTVNRTREELLAIDLFPFAEGIKAGAELVMTAHIIFSALDPQNPSTLSKTILQEVLRGELGFSGVILSDSMNMQAMLKNYAREDAAVRAFNAGVDLLMLAEEHYSHDAQAYLQQQTTLIGAVKGAVERGELPIERVNESARRVLALKLKHLAFPAGSQQPLSAQIGGGDANRQTELEIARHAVAVLRDQNKHIPIATDKPILLVNTTTRSSYAILGATRGIGPNQTKAAFDTFAEVMHQKYPHLREVSAEDVLQGKADALLNSNEIIVAVTENYPLPGVDFDQKSQPEVIRRLLDKARDRLVVVALRDPYELTALPEVPTYLCAFSFRPCSAQAAAEVLCGEIAPVGQTPVSIPSTTYAARENIIT
jgi:beta-N-acetylhexosaminidase